MTRYEIDRAMQEIVLNKTSECRARLDALPKDNANERKAVQIELGMYTLCGNAGLLFDTKGRNDNSPRDEFFRLRQGVFQRILPKYPKLHEMFVGLEGDEQLRFVAALQGEIFMRDQILGNYRTELANASAAQDARNVFEFTIKIGAVESVLEAWREWRMEHAIYPVELEELS